jgi:hypothetical protein
MQREIEALKRAYDSEVNREREFVHDILISLTQGAISRRRMIDEITDAVVRLRQRDTQPTNDPPQESLDALARYDWPSAYNEQ